MNSSIITSDAFQLEATTAYTAFPQMSEDSVSVGPAIKFSSWRKYLHKPIQQSWPAVVVALVAEASTTTEVPIMFSPAPTPTIEELMSGPLFQIAGMFEIGEPGWPDRHDEYLAETYLENHAESS
jgi:hypothetical protein